MSPGTAGADPGRNRFEQMYAAADGDPARLPWARGDVHEGLRRWLASAPPERTAGRGRPAVVVGCGLGDDAAELARRGWAVTAFDVAPSAIVAARARHDGVEVDWRVADLLALPADLRARFALVLEVFTIQSLPPRRRAEAVAAVRSLMAAGATLLVVAGMRPGSGVEDGPPWPLTDADLELLAAAGLASRLRIDGRSRGGRPMVVWELGAVTRVADPH